MSADIALINGKLLTMNPAQPIAEALAIKGKKIVKVGTNQEINRMTGNKTKIIHLNGKTVIPGFIDTHIHVTDFGRLLSWIDLRSIASIEQLQNAVKRRVDDTPKGRWILGRGWNEIRFKDCRLPTRSDLDQVSPENPVVLYHEMAQICLVNTKTLELLGIPSKTSTPQKGTIDKTVKTGELTGIFRDDATNLVWQKIPKPDEEELLEATAIALERILEAGITSVHWMILSPIEIEIAKKLHAQKRLPIKAILMVPANLLTKIRGFSLSKSSILRVGGAIVAVDGYLAAKTAALAQPYIGDKASKGQLLSTPEEINTKAERILKAGFQLILHAMGDKAVDTALIVIENIMRQQPKTRFRLEQAAVLNPKLVDRMKKQSIIVSVQPLVIASEFSIWHAQENLGYERTQWLYPLKTLVNNNVRIIGGSDCPMEPLSPLLGIHAAVTRENLKERLSVEDALRMYTVDAAYASGDEKTIGSIEEGKFADLVVLSLDPTMLMSSEIANISVELTLIDGQISYQKSG